MQKNTRISCNIYFVFTLAVFMSGIFYLTIPIVIPYQLQIRHVPWNYLEGIDLLTVWALANIAGIVLLQSTIVLLLLLITSYRKGETWGIVTVDITAFFTVALSLWTAFNISRKADAGTPWTIGLILLALYAAALVASIDPGRIGHGVSGFFHRKDHHVPPIQHHGA
jgi:hypothetical protein